MKEVSSDNSSSNNEDKEFNKEVVMEKESTSSENDAVKTITEQLPYCEFRKGRPDIEQVVADDLNETGSGSVAVVTCGHSNMCDDIRYKVSEEIYNRSNPIELIEELQG
ncbi:uncharacterized protein SCODWIG_02027 [Saccharomycodes ludwigii]|uniref:Ferric reductase NAD binding domain-containing protein n=2 Tax=Saccharomycodes ludwigii TaxID=36035 RepID=A0A376B6E5_9ASCO|nr:uncharacterized protein SCODWIG_02027 [Saccharomycodes ludwigii]